MHCLKTVNADYVYVKKGSICWGHFRNTETIHPFLKILLIIINKALLQQNSTLRFS